jgi:hypothetical protein
MYVLLATGVFAGVQTTLFLRELINHGDRATIGNFLALSAGVGVFFGFMTAALVAPSFLRSRADKVLALCPACRTPYPRASGTAMIHDHSV